MREINSGRKIETFVLKNNFNLVILISINNPPILKLLSFISFFFFLRDILTEKQTLTKLLYYISVGIWGQTGDKVLVRDRFQRRPPTAIAVAVALSNINQEQKAGGRSCRPFGASSFEPSWKNAHDRSCVVHETDAHRCEQRFRRFRIFQRRWGRRGRWRRRRQYRW